MPEKFAIVHRKPSLPFKFALCYRAERGEIMATGGRALPKPQTKQPEPETLSLTERIRERAHEIYLERGGQDGSEFDDWLQAEQEILGSEPEHTA
jgi:Protein of unknown function (DUF2934)